MNVSFRKIYDLLWFLKHPQLYPELFRRVTKVRKLFLRTDPCDTGEQSLRWCESLAIGTREAIGRITGGAMHKAVREEFPSVFAEAEVRGRNCPVVMGGPGNLDLLYWMAEYLKAERVVETGVAYGWSSLAILLSLKERKNGKLVSTDFPYPWRNNEKHVGCVVPNELRSSWRIVRMADRKGLPVAFKELGEIDLCHYDSDKSYEGRMWAYPRLWNALRPGGCLITDDVKDNLGFHDFCAQIGEEPIIVEMSTEFGSQYSGVLFKRD